MKTLKISLIIIYLFTGLQVFAQQGRMGNNMSLDENKIEKIMQKKMAFMKENLLLTKQEAAAFEKLYTKYTRDKMQWRMTMKKEFQSKIRNGQYMEMSDKELNLLLDKKMELEKKRTQMELDFYQKLRKILPPKKVVKFFKLERRFNKKMIERYKKGKRQRPQHRKSRGKQLH